MKGAGRAGEAGIARIHVILICLCAVLLVLVMIPGYRYWQYHGEWLTCASSLRVVNGALVIELLANGEASRLEDAESGLETILPGREGYCPTGGTVYFQREKDGEWKAVCGLHDSDHAKRTRLNASYVLRNLRQALLSAQRRGDALPKELTVGLNGKELRCALVEKEAGIRRGTSTTKGYEDKGTVAFYGLSGLGSFADCSEKSGFVDGDGTEAPGICYFCFADEDNNAVWREDDGWRGSSYGDKY